MKNRLLVFLLALGYTALAQTAFPFDVVLEPVSINGLPGMQSYAAGEHEGKWLVIGGRLDGLHQRQPWQSFDEAGHNTNVYVIDPVAGSYWSAPLSGIGNDTIEAQLAATNPNFTQVGDYLYIVGGYGLDAAAVHATHPRLTIVDIPAAIASITSGGTFTAAMLQSLPGEPFAVTGGKLMYADGTFYLVGGQRFDGQYNPMGHNTYVQTYTEAVRPFTVGGTFPNFTVALDTNDYIVHTDHLHRRDYNVTYMTDGTETFFTSWAGVFQKTVDLPFLNVVEVRDSGIYPVPNFSQYLNHYHCATTSLYSDSTGNMYTLFFGGIAQYFYDANGDLVQDNNVPFVETVGITTRTSSGDYHESYSATKMPGYYGAGAEFFPVGTAGFNGMWFATDSIGSDTATIGYIFGGIDSPAPNVFFGGQTNPSTATSNIYRVKLVRNHQIGITEFTPQGHLGLQVQPNPTKGRLIAQVDSKLAGSTSFEVLDASGRVVFRKGVPTRVGKNTVDLGNLDLSAGTYTLSASQGGVHQQVKFMWMGR